MQKQKTWKMLVKHLSGEESDAEKELFLKWLDLNEKNKILFYNVKKMWDDEYNLNESSNQNITPTFFGRFTKQKIKNFILNQAVGNLIGFMIGMWVTASFSHYVLEKRGIKNLFGLAGRKKITVNEIPEWLQNGIAILVGFIALELINHFFQTKKYLIIWGFIKNSYLKIKVETKKGEN
jgi:hypothetical protein